jgi:hypothetical protein
MVAVSALRSALAAVGNAEAVPASHGGAGGGTGAHFAGAGTGLGAAEVVRRRLTQTEVAAIIQGEVDERLAAAAGYERSGHDNQATRLRREADILALTTSLHP